MSGMTSVFKNNLCRAASQKGRIILMLSITFITILLAVFFTSKMQVRGNIAVVSDQGAVIQSSKYLKVHHLDTMPPQSDLVLNKYDAVVIPRGDGDFTIDTIKSDDFKNTLENALKHPGSPGTDTKNLRGEGTNILGYLTMFILLQGVLFMMYFAEDKENKVIRRVVTSPVSIRSYLAAHSLFNLVLIWVPTMAVLVVCKEILKVKIGFSYLQYAGLIGLLALLATAFAIFICSLMDKSDNSNTLGATIVTLTSLLAGSFFAFKMPNGLMEKVIDVLPQKHFMTLVQGMEQGKEFSRYFLQIGYLGLLILTLYAAASGINWLKFRQGKY